MRARTCFGLHAGAAAKIVNSESNNSEHEASSDPAAVGAVVWYEHERRLFGPAVRALPAFGIATFAAGGQLTPSLGHFQQPRFVSRVGRALCQGQ